MWNLISASKVTQDRVERKNYDMHRKKVKSMKGLLKIKEPQQFQFVFSKNKLEMSRRDRLIEIQKQNEILVRKMENIKEARYTENKLRPEAQHLKTLNQQMFNIKAQSIFKQNKRICDKLIKISSYYPTSSIMDKTEQLERVCLNISQNGRRIKSAKSLMRPQSSYTSQSAKFYRSGSKSINKFESRNKYESELENLEIKRVNRPDSAPFLKKYNKADTQQNEMPSQGKVFELNNQELYNEEELHTLQ